MGSAKKKRPAAAADKPAPDHQHRPVTSRTNYYLAFLLVIATALLYGHSLWNPLVFDDLHVFVDANLKRLGSSLFHLDLRWFSYASFGWTYNLFGLDWFWYRLGNLALHALTGILLFVFFSRLLDATQPQDAVARPHWPAFFAALVFVLHPAAVYGVTYLVQRSILMATLFGITALLCYMEGLSRDRARWFVLSALFYFLAVFSKEHSIMIPGVAVALTLLLHKPSLALIRRVWLPFSLYLVIGALIILQTKGLLGAAYEPRAANILARMSEQQDIHIANAYSLSVLTQGYLFFKYLLLWIVPYTGWMSVDISQPFATRFLSWPELPGFILFLAYPLLAVKLLLKGGRQGLLGFGLMFPWILYLTELASVRIQEPFVLYRSYLWMSGLPIVLFGFMGATPKKHVPVLLAACCLVLAGLAWNRLDTFSDNIKTWSDAIDKYWGDNLLRAERAYNNRGTAYYELGQIQRAQEDFMKAATLNPGYEAPHFNLGAINLELKNFQTALQNYNTGIELKPDDVKARINRSTIFLQMGRYADALNDCEYALRLDAQNTDAYLNCSVAHSHMGKTQEALRYLDDVLRIDQKNAIAYYNRGFIHNAMGHYQNALQDYGRAIELNPDYVDAYVQRGGLYMTTKRLPQAILEFDRAVQLSPGNPLFYLNRGAVNFNLGKFQEALNDADKALSLYDRTLRLDADYNKILLYRGFALSMLNRKNEAMESFRRSCEAGNTEACKQLH